MAVSSFGRIIGGREGSATETASCALSLRRALA
jgi:hypothetical protein